MKDVPTGTVIELELRSTNGQWYRYCGRVDGVAQSSEARQLQAFALPMMGRSDTDMDAIYRAIIIFILTAMIFSCRSKRGIIGANVVVDMQC
jgi:hypothetical protein